MWRSDVRCLVLISRAMRCSELTEQVLIPRGIRGIEVDNIGVGYGPMHRVCDVRYCDRYPYAMPSTEAGGPVLSGVCDA
eukprot:1386651-Rhodomonas_salina.3